MFHRWTWLLVLLVRTPWLACALLLPLALLILLAVQVGKFVPQLPLYLATGDCTQPCWQGLQPGLTRSAVVLALAANEVIAAPGTLVVDEADQVTVARWETRYFPSYDVQARLRADVLLRLDLNVDGLLLLGDALAVFGEPSHVALCPRVATTFNYRNAVSATLYFDAGAVEVWAYLLDSGRWQVRPDMRVLQITYHTAPPPDEPWIPLGAAAWHGFGSAGYSAGCR